MNNFDTDKIEPLIIKNLFDSDTYTRTYIEKINPELFSEKYKGIIVGIQAYFKRYSDIPSRDILEKVILPKVFKQDEENTKKSIDCLESIFSITGKISDEFIADETKRFIKTRTIMNAFIKCVDLLEKQDHESIVSIMETSFGLSFDETLGQEYFEDLEDRLNRCTTKERPISTGLETLDRSVGGGYRKKGVFIYAAASNVGKTLMLNDAALNLVQSGNNVLYISLELTQDYISERTDAKFAEVSMNEINAMPEKAIEKAIKKRDAILKSGKKYGKLYYKEYSPGSVSCNDIKALLKNLEVKKKFKADVIIIDYLKLLKPNGKVYGDSNYNKYDQISIDIKALAKDHDAVMLSAVQTGRQSFGSNTVGMEDISDSIAIAQNADVVITLAKDDTLNKEDMIRVNIAKSRFSRNSSSFLLKVDYEYMRLVDIETKPSDSFVKPKPSPVQKSEPIKKKQIKVDNDFGIEM